MSIKSEMNARVDSVLGKTRSTNAEIAALSRDIIPYVCKTNDSEAVNRLIGGLKTSDRRVACQFFPKFLGWEWDKEAERFGTKSKDKILQAKKDAFEKELEAPDFNIWTWYDAKGSKDAPKPKDHRKIIGNAIKAGLADEDKENSLSLADIAALLHASGVDMRTLLKLAESYANIQALDS